MLTTNKDSFIHCIFWVAFNYWWICKSSMWLKIEHRDSRVGCSFQCPLPPPLPHGIRKPQSGERDACFGDSPWRCRPHSYVKEQGVIAREPGSSSERENEECVCVQVMDNVKNPYWLWRENKDPQGVQRTQWCLVTRSKPRWFLNPLFVE